VFAANQQLGTQGHVARNCSAICRLLCGTLPDVFLSTHICHVGGTFTK